MSADETKRPPVELAELPGRPGYTVEGEVEPEPAHAATCRCVDCRIAEVKAASAREAARWANVGASSAKLPPLESFPGGKHHPMCGCADCRIARRNAEPTHQVVPGELWGLTTACGLHVETETPPTARPKFANPGEAPTCAACLAAKRAALMVASDEATTEANERKAAEVAS